MKSAFQEFNQIEGQIENSFHEAAMKFHLSDSELWILYVLITSESEVVQAELGRITGIRKTTINSALKKMEREGLVTLTPGKGRNTCVVLTDQGNQLAQGTVCRLIAMENRIYENWSPREREVLIRLNRDYADRLAEQVKSL